MKTFNCLIVDDEPIARDILVTYCGHLPSLHVSGICGNGLEAKKVLSESAIDILFLDIHLPVIDGISFFSTLKNPPQVIFTTAYKEYAVNAFDLAACDYLIKPFLLDRFIVAVDKAIERINGSAIKKEKVSELAEDSFFVRAEGRIYKVIYTDLLYAEAKGNYTSLVTDKSTIVPNMAFIAVEKILPPAIFTRVHRSFIINHSKITHLEGNRVFIGEHEIPIGSNYKEAFLRSLGL